RGNVQAITRPLSLNLRFELGMKVILKLIVFFVFAFIFFSSCFGTARLTAKYLEEKNTRSVENNPSPYFWIMAFKGNDVQTIHFEELEDFKKSNRDYSFLVPKDKSEYFNQKFADNRSKPMFEFDVEQLSEDRQLIKLTSAGSTTSGKDWYEATNKEVFPKKSWVSGYGEVFPLLGIGFLGGTIPCLVFFFIYRRFIKPRLFQTNLTIL
ncbi:MAG: hypothetical protein ABJA66_13365, partial [Actinomycetota bacterium]